MSPLPSLQLTMQYTPPLPPIPQQGRQYTPQQPPQQYASFFDSLYQAGRLRLLSLAGWQDARTASNTIAHGRPGPPSTRTASTRPAPTRTASNSASGRRPGDTASPSGSRQADAASGGRPGSALPVSRFQADVAGAVLGLGLRPRHEFVDPDGGYSIDIALPTRRVAGARCQAPAGWRVRLFVTAGAGWLAGLFVSVLGGAAVAPAAGAFILLSFCEVSPPPVG